MAARRQPIIHPFSVRFLLLAFMALSAPSAPLNARADLNGQDKRKVHNLNGTFSADRVTDSSYQLNFGITFDFGSVFNNVMNTLFPRDVRGSLFF